MNQNYTFTFEVSYTPNRKADSEVWNDTLVVEGESEERAREYAEHVLEERYPGEENYILLSLELVA